MTLTGPSAMRRACKPTATASALAKLSFLARNTTLAIRMGLGCSIWLDRASERPRLWRARDGSGICHSERQLLWCDDFHQKGHLHDALAAFRSPILGGGEPNCPESKGVQHGKVCLGRMYWISR